MSIEIKDLNDVVNSLKSNYITRLSSMSFIMGLKEANDDYYIYQEIVGLPIKRFVCCPSDRTFCIAASWQSKEHWYSLVKDANDEEIEAWKNLLDQTRPYNKILDKYGLTKKDWMIVEKIREKKGLRYYNKYPPPKSEKFDTFLEMRIPFVKRVNFYDWGFEFISNKIIMVAVDHRNIFPYDIENCKSEKVFVSRANYERTDMDSSIEDIENPMSQVNKDSGFIDIYDIHRAKENENKEFDTDRHLSMSWVGNKIIFRKIKEDTTNNNEYYDITNKLISFWDFSPCHQDDIDKELENIILFGVKKEKKENVLDIGQRQFKHLDLDLD